MYREPRAGVHVLVWWLTAPAVLVCAGLILPQWSAWAALALVGVVTALGTAGLWQVGSFLCSRVDPFLAEELAARRRLTSLRSQVEQIELTLRDLRSLRLGPLETIRARWAEVDLDEALRPLRRAMARERALLLSLDAARWINRAQPLLAEISRRDEQHVTGRLFERLQDLREAGAGILARLRLDTEAASCSLGAAVSELLAQALTELERVAREPGCGPGRFPAWEAWHGTGADPGHTVERLKHMIEQLRARRHRPGRH